MIRAEDALKLPNAQLSEAELQRADKALEQIEAYVREGMQHNGVDLKLTEREPKVIAHVHQQLKLAGWTPTWEALVEGHALNKAIRQVVGFRLILAPSDEAYAAARKSSLS